MPPLPGSNGSSPVTTEQPGHDLLMRQGARAPRGDPFVVRREGGLDLGFFQGLGRCVPFERLEPSQLGERDDGGSLPAKMNYLIRPGGFRDASGLHAHTGTVPEIYRSRQAARPAAEAEKQADEPLSVRYQWRFRRGRNVGERHYSGCGDRNTPVATEGGQ